MITTTYREPMHSRLPLPEHFYYLFNLWTQSAGFVSSKGQLELDTDGTIISTGTRFFLTNLRETEDITANINNIRKVTDGSSIPCFVNGFTFDFYEQYVRVNEYLVTNLGYVALGVGLSCWVFLLHPGAMLIMLSVIAMIIIETYGLLYFMGLKINGVCVVNLVMAVGVSVEFTCYIIRSFMVTTGTRQQRATAAFLAMAVPTANGGIATFVGIIVMAFAVFPYFKIYFFNMYVLIIFIGMGNGLLLLPVILSWIEPDSLSQSVNKPPNF